MSIDDYYSPSELERLEENINRNIGYKTSSLEKRIDSLEGTIYDTHEETTTKIELVKKELEKPFTKIEGICLFFMGCGLTLVTPPFNGIILFIGIVLFMTPFGVWLYYFRDTLKKK